MAVSKVRINTGGFKDRPIFLRLDMKRLITLLILASLFIGCKPATQPPLPSTLQSGPAPETESAQWWRDAVFYEIFVRSFYDSNGDGIGDFNGIIQKLDYLTSLGVNAVWLMPIHPSPSYHGYDVLDYYAVNPQYGTMDDFKNLLNEAHKRDIKIIIDLVLNHTSSEHPFFVDANNNLQSPYRDWYVWTGVSNGSHWHKGNNGFYYGFFDKNKPDLNYNNPEVTKEMEKVVDYWLNNIGVDGLRVDAAKHLIEEGSKFENTQATHDWFKGFYTFYKSSRPEAYTIGEVFGAGAFLANTYREQFDHIFNFELANGFVGSTRAGTNTPINSAVKFTLKDDPEFNFATFLANHDQNRVMSVLGEDIQKAKLAAFLLLTTPGTPFIYYGEEIGMMGEKPDEDIRLPMQWSADANAGFTTGTPWRTPNESYTRFNVALQEDDPDSLLNHYRTLVRIRQDHSALRTGEVFIIETGNSGSYAVLCMNENETILILTNLTEESISDYALTLTNAPLPDSTLHPATLFGSAQIQPITVSQGGIQNYMPVSELQPYSTLIVQFQP